MDEFKVLVVDDEEDMLEVCRDSLRPLSGVQVVTESSGHNALALLFGEAFDLLILDLRMPDLSGLELMQHARERQPQIQVLMITGFPTIDTAVRAIKQGALDYIVKPFRPEQLREKVEHARHLSEARVQGLPGEDPASSHSFEGIIGKSPPMQAVFDAIRRVAPTSSDVLILGESGTGKELVARSVHSLSGREGRFIAVDCGAIPEHLLESELFGHEKGAFTGAERLKRGLLEAAHEGTFFLDEICELAPGLQSKLLRALQERALRRVGGDVETPVDVRVVAATNRDIEREVRERRFREDLFYRVNVIKIQLPPLRDRGDDLPILAEHFVRILAGENRKTVLGIAPDVMQVLRQHEWPGNVRELQNAMRHAVSLARDEVIQVRDLSDDLSDAKKSAELKFFSARSGKLRTFEREYLVQLIRDVNGEISKAAEIASIPRSTLYRLLKKHRIHPRDFR